MEEPQQETDVGVEPPFSFTPHRRPLRSGTYLNLVQFLSLCYGDSPLATAPPIIPLPQEPDNGNNRDELSGDDAQEPRGLVATDCSQAASVQAQEGKVGDGGFENNLMVNSSIEGTDFQDEEIFQGQMLMAELENILKENEDCDKSSNLMILIVDNS